MATKTKEIVFNKEIEHFSKIHPGGDVNLSVAANSVSSAQDMLFLSYHTGRNLKKIEAVTKMHGFSNTPITNLSDLFLEIHEIFVSVQSKYWIHGIIYRLYAAGIGILFVFSLIYNIFDCCLYNSILLMFTWVSYSFVIFHTRHHLGNNLFGIKWLDNNLKLYLDIFDNIFAVPPKQWLYNHQLSHHMYPNTDDDYDITNPYPMLRLLDNSNFKLMQIHKYQYIYSLPLFTANVFTFPLKNLQNVPILSYIVNNQIHKDNKIKAIDGHWICLLLWILILLVFPCYFHGFYALKTFFCVTCLGSLFISILFQISHHVSKVKHNNIISNINNYDKWIKSQIEASMSWGGYLETLIFGGINFQIEHHIAPAIIPIYYYFAYKEIRNLCKKYYINYVYYDNFAVALYEYEKYVFRINNKT